MKRIGRTVMHISFMEFQNWVRGSRMVILGVILVFIHMQVAAPLKECAVLMGAPVSVAEAFIALGNSGVIVMIVPLLFLVLTADFPQKGAHQFFYQIRYQKRTWIVGQIVFFVKAACALTGFLAVSSMVMILPYAKWNRQFSYAVTNYATHFPERSGDYIAQLIPENLYQQMTLRAALLHTVLLMLLYFLVLSLILVLSSLCNRRSAGIFADSFLIITGSAVCSAHTKAMWLFPMAHTIPWLHYGKYLSRMEFPMAGSYIYMAIAAGGLLLGCLAAEKQYQVGKG